MQQENTDKLMKPGQGGGPAPQKVDPKWFVQLFIKPRATLKAILEKDRPVWLIPLLMLSVLAAVEALVFSHLDNFKNHNAIVEISLLFLIIFTPLAKGTFNAWPVIVVHGVSCIILIS